MSSVSSLNSLLSSTNASTSSSSIDLSSLLSAATGATSSGIDVTTAVAAAIYAAQAPERQWQAQQATIKSQITALTTIQSSLSTLSGDLDSLNNLGGPLSARAVSSSSPAVSATAAAGAAVGTHVVQVKSLATTASWYSPPVANSSGSLGALSMQIVGQDGSTHVFQTGTGVNTLAQLATAINGSSAGVTASVVQDASGSRLALVGASSGGANDFSVSFGKVSGASWLSSAAVSATSPLAAGSFTVGDGAQTSTVTVAAGDTLNDVANKINSAGSDITASVVTDSGGSHLSLSSATGTVAVAGDPTFSMQRASSGTNASLTVDGIPVSSASNQVSGVVSGLTFNLQGVTADNAQATLSVSADASQMASAVTKFVTDYNAALSGVNAQFAFDPSSSSQGVLSGDSTVRSLQSALMSMVSYSSSAGGASAGKATLAGLGVTMGDDGTLSVDSGALAAKVTADPTGVQSFFQGASLNGFAQAFQTQLKTYTKASTGALAVGISNLNQSYTALQGQVDDYESGYIASQRTVLTSMYSKAEIALQSLPATMKQLEAQLGGNSGS